MNYFFHFAIFIFLICAKAEAEVLTQKNSVTTESQAVDTYLNEKQKVVAVDQQSREVMSTLYQINQRMKNMSRKRDILNNKVIGAEGNVRSLAKSTAALEEKIQEQRARLSKRLKAIYMLGDEGIVRVIFSSASAQDLNESLKYLKLISDHDYVLIKNYEKDLKLFNSKKTRLKEEVRGLLSLKDRFKKQETQLTADQESKAKILDHLRAKRTNSLVKLSQLRESAGLEAGLFDLSFYEQKGQLLPPTSGSLLRDFGMIESPEFQYRLSHKGLLYETNEGSHVRSVSGGTVAFVGRVDGYGKTIVVDHGDHYYSVYSNLASAVVSEGQSLEKSAEIAKSGSELYFEIRHFSDAIDPKRWLTDI